MPEEIRLFEISRDKPLGDKTTRASQPPCSRGEAPGAGGGKTSTSAASKDSERTYWEKKLQELTLENIKLQQAGGEAIATRQNRG